METYYTSIFTHYNGIERIPLGNKVAFLNLISMLEIERAAVWHVHSRKYYLGVGIDKPNLGKTAYNHLALNLRTIWLALYIRYCAKLIELYERIVLCNNAGIGSCITSHTTGMERTKSKLSSWLTNSLCRYDTDSLAKLYHSRCGKVAAVTLHADSLLAFTSEDRTNLHALYR